MPKEKIKVRATVVYVPLEMGFWGLQATNGAQYEPINLPKNLQENGKEVSLTLELLDRESMRMWGQVVRVVA